MGPIIPVLDTAVMRACALVVMRHALRPIKAESQLALDMLARSHDLPAGCSTIPETSHCCRV